MKKETVSMFDLEAAFKALDEIDVPKVSAKEGFKANRANLTEYFHAKAAHEVLVEDYFDVNDSEDLNAAKEEREAEVAKAKLARIEKIVDLDAETEDDILPSYVGKVIMQCPQCMTLFYKNEEDIEKSEETPDVVNVNEICQHCGNSSGYTLVGKVGGIEEAEAANFDMDEVDFEEDELNLDFPEEGTEEVDAEGTGEGADFMSEEDSLDDLDLDFEEEEEADEEETEEANESLQNSKLLDKIEDKNDLKTDIESEHLTLNEDAEPTKSNAEDKEAVDTFDVYIDKSGSGAQGTKADPMVKDFINQHPEAKVAVHYFDDFKYSEPLAAARAGKTIIVYTDEDYKTNCPELENFDNVTIVNVMQEELNEDLADWYRKKFDRPASSNTQQAWEDELNGEMGEISDERRAHLERKFAQQRDWEARHPDKVKEVPTIQPVEVEEPAMAESMHNSELLDKIEAKNDLKTDIESDHLTLTESSVADGDVDALYDELWSQPQPTDEETEANLQSLASTADTFESFDELDDTFDEHITEYLKEVYSNIDAYKSTNCTTKGSKLVIEGVIKFQSGREKVTKFTFKTGKRIKESFVLRGTNEGLTSEQSAFRLACKTEGAKLITESFNYKYSIDGTNVKGSTRK
jgi:hypothetical protein